MENSLLRQEEKSFPRGGASALTPLEHRQIQIEATKDVLFGESGSKKRTTDIGSDEDDDFAAERPASPVAPKKKRRKESSKHKDQSLVLLEKKTRIEGLGVKSLVPGTIVLGRVAQITSKDVVISLPNNLSGFVPLTELSDQLNRRVEKLLEKVDEDADEESEEDFEDIDLKKLFRVGQFVRAYVTNNGSEGSSSGKKRIDLSLNPRLANHGLTKADIVANTFVQASVVSVEDHGLIMDLALEDATLKGFVSSKDLDNIKHTDLEEGSVLLCMVLGSNNDGRIIKLSADYNKIGNTKKSHFLETASVRAFGPGTAVDLLISDSTDHGIRGKIMGMIEATADVVHVGSPKTKDVSKRLAVGSKVKARIIYKLPGDDDQALGVSLLEPILTLHAGAALGPAKEDNSDSLAISSIVEGAKVIKVQSNLGLFFDIGASGLTAFAHISRISDKKVDSLSSDSGSYKIGSKHKARIIGFNMFDGQYIVSLEQKVLDQPFIRIEDVQVGQIVHGTVEKIIVNERGVGGVLIKLSEGLSGLVPEMHMADVHLQHPDRKFREGLKVKARVLSTNPDKRQIRLTLKKTLVNSDVKPWVDYDKIEVGAQSPGTLVNILADGAVVQFYGTIRGYLPVSEMSEAYIEDARQHFKVGQVVNVRVLDVNSENGKMTVSSKDPGSFGREQIDAFNNLSGGDIVTGSIVEISNDLISLTLDSGIKAILRLRHLADGLESQCRSALKKLRVGQKLADMVFISKDDRRKVVFVTNKPKIKQAASSSTLYTGKENPKTEVVGFVRNITATDVFVEFPGGHVALLPQVHLTDELKSKPNFGLEIGETISAKVIFVDHANQKTTLSLRDQPVSSGNGLTRIGKAEKDSEVVNPVDGTSSSHSDFSLGKVTRVRITSVKATQLNVQLSDNVQGRVDATELFENWDSIRDRKNPLCVFKAKQVLDVKVIGIHDMKSRRFLPLSHRTGNSVYELSAKNLSSNKVLAMDDLKVGDDMIGFVNNYGDGCLWVSLSPSVRGRVGFMDLSEDTSILNDLAKNFPIGTAIKLQVKTVDVAGNKLDLTAVGKSRQLSDLMTLSQLAKGTVLAGRVTKVMDRAVVVQLNNSVTGVVPLTELADDYEEANPRKHFKNEILKVKVIDIDQANKKVTLSARPSQVLSSTLPVKDRQIMTSSQLKVNDVVRGFVKNVADKGIFLSLGPTVTGFVRISDISDDFVKEWREVHTVDDLVSGKILQLDTQHNSVRMSLKASALDPNYVPPLTFDDLQLKQIITGKVRKVEAYGVFIVVDNSQNVSGLCHKSQIADQRVEDVTKLYEEGDAVKAIVLKINKAKKQISFGLKASYFEEDEADSGAGESESDDDRAINNESDSSDDDEDDNVDPADREVKDIEDSANESDDDSQAGDEANETFAKKTNGLSAGGFDWTGGLMDLDNVNLPDDEPSSKDQKKKKKKAEIQVDKTGELDKYGPRADKDFERLLMHKANDSALWIQYMAFQLGLGEVEKARAIAERALTTINIMNQDEKLNIWSALLNLENTYGTDESIEEVFKRACEYQDKDEIHERLVNIFIESGHNAVSSHSLTLISM